MRGEELRVIGTDSGFFSSLNSLSKYSDELLVALSLVETWSFSKQEAIHPSSLIRSCKMKKSHSSFSNEKIKKEIYANLAIHYVHR